MGKARVYSRQACRIPTWQSGCRESHDFGKAGHVPGRARGEARVGKRFRTCRDVEIVVYPGGCLDIGDDVYVGHASVIACSGHLRIGSDTLIADMVTIRDKDHGIAPGILIRKNEGSVKEISIGRNCWLGSKVTVTAGAAIGDNVVVGANAVVTKRFGNNLLLGGVPAVVIHPIECGEARPAAQRQGLPGDSLI